MSVGPFLTEPFEDGSGRFFRLRLLVCCGAGAFLGCLGTSPSSFELRSLALLDDLVKVRGPKEEQRLLNTAGPMPRAMIYSQWAFPGRLRPDDISVDVTIHNDIQMRDHNGLYLIGCTGSYIEAASFYFGLQTNVNDPRIGSLGKGAIFSRWYESNKTADVRLPDTRVPEHGWTEGGDYEGNFVSVRGLYEWAAGTYSLQLRGAEVDDSPGRWFEYWVVDESGAETWIGSIRFPLVNGQARIHRSCYSTIEVYGRPTKPSEIPFWKVSVNGPMAREYGQP